MNSWSGIDAAEAEARMRALGRRLAELDEAMKAGQDMRARNPQSFSAELSLYSLAQLQERLEAERIELVRHRQLERLEVKLRFEVFKRDLFVCQYCGRSPPTIVLELDHILPVKEGGKNDEENLLTSCFDCNRGKGGNTLEAAPRSLEEKAAEIEERESQLACYREIMEARYDRIEADMWRVADALVPKSSKNGMRRDWLRSIKMFNERLPLHSVLDAAEIAIAAQPYSERTRFRYFCGVCWNKIKRGSD